MKESSNNDMLLIEKKIKKKLCELTGIKMWRITLKAVKSRTGIVKVLALILCMTALFFLVTITK